MILESPFYCCQIFFSYVFSLQLFKYYWYCHAYFTYAFCHVTWHDNNLCSAWFYMGFTVPCGRKQAYYTIRDQNFYYKECGLLIKKDLLWKIWKENSLSRADLKRLSLICSLEWCLVFYNGCMCTEKFLAFTLEEHREFWLVHEVLKGIQRTWHCLMKVAITSEMTSVNSMDVFMTFYFAWLMLVEQRKVCPGKHW